MEHTFQNLMKKEEANVQELLCKTVFRCDIRSAQLIDLLIEMPSLTIREGARKLKISENTAFKNVNKWNELSEAGQEDTFCSFLRKQPETILEDKHIAYIFNLMEKNPLLGCSEAIMSLSEEFQGISVTARSLRSYMRNRLHLRYKRTQSQLYNNLNDKDTIRLRHEFVSAWVKEKIDFFSEVAFISETKFSRSVKRIKAWPGLDRPCRTTTNASGPNATIIAAISSNGVINISMRKAEKDLAQEKTDLQEFVDQVVHTIVTKRLPHKYLLFDYSLILKYKELEKCVEYFDHKLLFLPPHSFFLSPVEGFWGQLEHGLNTDVSSVKLENKLSERLIWCSRRIAGQDCKSWIEHSLSFWSKCLEKKSFEFK